jgi:hypothetical protein
MIFHVFGTPQHAQDGFYSRRSRQNSVFGQFLSSCEKQKKDAVISDLKVGKVQITAHLFCYYTIFW